MTVTICSLLPSVGQSIQDLGSNHSYARYACRAGYRLQSGDLYRTCNGNGTWTGIQPVCTVDSVLPKAYLVVLIVGATIAVFLACIPYDFYRFKKRKKKVRDHQERLSLVTRIAPGHAKVVLETVPVEQTAASQVQPRRFGFKSLFSVFRFVGGKMKAGQDLGDTINTDEHKGSSESHHEHSSLSDTAAESDDVTGSSQIFGHKHTPLLPARKFLDIVKEKKAVTEPERTSGSTSPLILYSSDRPESEYTETDHATTIKQANEIFNGNLQSQQAGDSNSSCNRIVLKTSQSFIPQSTNVKMLPPITTSGGSTSSSPDVLSLKKERSSPADFRTFYLSRAGRSNAYHSMPTVTNIQKL